MLTMTYILIAVSLLLIAFIAVKFLWHKPGQGKQSELIASETVNSSKKFFMSYEEALEASKQFIYDTIKMVMQKFSPDDVKILLQLGKNLAVNGVKYMHVVDVQALQYQKFVHAKQQSSKSAGR